jgi:replication factor A1
MEHELTTGIVARAFNAVDPTEVEDLQPTVQLLSIKKVANARDSSTPDRYRIIVSDGVQFIQAMLATQLNDLVESNQLRRNVIVRLTKFAAQNISSKRWGVISHEDEPLILCASEF